MKSHPMRGWGAHLRPQTPQFSLLLLDQHLAVGPAQPTLLEVALHFRALAKAGDDPPTKVTHRPYKAKWG